MRPSLRPGPQLRFFSRARACSAAAVLAFILLLLAPTAAAVASPSLLGTHAEDPQRQPAAEVKEQVHGAEHTAGIPHQEAPSPRDAPRDLGAPIVATAATVGLVGLCALAVFYGGARFVTSQEALGHETRRAIYALIQRDPGTTQRQITRAIGLTTTNAIWHLGKLETAGLVLHRRAKGLKLYYAASGGRPARERSLARTAFSNRNAANLVQHVVRNPGCTLYELAQTLGVHSGTIRWHAKKLEHLGYLRSTPGTPRRLHPAPAAASALAEGTSPS